MSRNNYKKLKITIMPNTKKSGQGTTTGQSNSSSKRNQKNSKGMQPAAMPRVPTARERAKDMDSNRRWNAQTFEL